MLIKKGASLEPFRIINVGSSHDLVLVEGSKVSGRGERREMEHRAQVRRHKIGTQTATPLYQRHQESNLIQ